jgi:uncharacterized membrane protein
MHVRLRVHVPTVGGCPRATDHNVPVRFLLPRSIPGLIGAALLWVAGLAPSLLPRPTVIAVALAGLLWSVGYAAGCLVALVARAFVGGRQAAHWTVTGAVIAGAAWAGAMVQTILASQWQQQQAASLGLTDVTAAPWWVLLLGGVLVGWVLVLVGRALRSLARVVARAAGGDDPGPGARTLGFLTPVLLVVLLVALGYGGVLVAYTRINSEPTGLAAPTSNQRSGGPASEVPFGSLGAEGQSFVTGGPTSEEIAAYTGAAALEPIRVYVGVDSAPTPQERADLAVAELRRAGAFDRDLLVIATSTGNGFLDPALVAAPEFLTGGDVATVSTQYSVLPSWLSFLVDQRASQEEAQALWHAVLNAVAVQPEGKRPRLAVSGESLGAFASQSVFAGQLPASVASAVDTAVWVGSPAASALWPAWRDARTAGPAWEPVIGDGSIARDPATAASGQWSAPAWGERRLVLTQHANDPVSWWSPSLIWQRPDWLDDPRGPGVDPRTTWWPFVLFAQTGLDLAAAGAVPAGVGHNYAEVTAQAWAYAIDAPGANGAWSAADTDRLNVAIAASGDLTRSA